MEAKAERVWEPEGIEDTKEARSSRHNRADAYELTETEAAGTGPAWSAPDGILGLKGQIDMCPNP